jgi:peptidoglycan-associated lipoprotein
MEARALLMGLALGLSAVACSPKKDAATPATATASPPDAPALREPSPEQREAVAAAAETNQGGGLSFSPDVLRLCPGVHAPRFGYDSAELRTEWAQALGTLSDCMKSGGLKDKALLLTGHTDPRGGEDYNMALGSRRAEATKQAISEFGVEGSRLSTSSRGKAEAQGTDDASWAQDRRVDISLRQ